jgi:hypothetical protein
MSQSRIKIIRFSNTVVFLFLLFKKYGVNMKDCSYLSYDLTLFTEYRNAELPGIYLVRYRIEEN